MCVDSVLKPYKSNKINSHFRKVYMKTKNFQKYDSGRLNSFQDIRLQSAAAFMKQAVVMKTFISKT